MELRIRNEGEVTIIDLSGKMRAGEDIKIFRHEVKRLVGEGRLSVLVNLKQIGRVDSSGLGELIAGYATLGRSGGTLKLLNLTDSVVELMMMTKLLTVFEVFEDEDQAVRSFGPAGTKERRTFTAAAGGPTGEIKTDGQVG